MSFSSLGLYNNSKLIYTYKSTITHIWASLRESEQKLWEICNYKVERDVRNQSVVDYKALSKFATHAHAQAQVTHISGGSYRGITTTLIAACA